MMSVSSHVQPVERLRAPVQPLPGDEEGGRDQQADGGHGRRAELLLEEVHGQQADDGRRDGAEDHEVAEAGVGRAERVAPRQPAQHGAGDGQQVAPEVAEDGQ
jgi:hypothetical protein